MKGDCCNDPRTENILKNIDFIRQGYESSSSVGCVALVSGSADDQAYWQERFGLKKAKLFNRDGQTQVFSLEEKIGEKKRQGNFLGTLLAYQKLLSNPSFNPQDMTLLGMLFGRGERISPFTQIEANRKPAITLMSPRSDQPGLTAMNTIEEALYYSGGLVDVLKQAGFHGVLCKWGDETQIPSRDLSGLSGLDFSGHDIIKFISRLEVTEELARQKDWVIFDSEDTMLEQLSRNTKENLLREISTFEDARTGISLGTVAVSRAFLETALEVFRQEILADGIYCDFDPYLIKALCVSSREDFLQQAKADSNLAALLEMIPDFFDKVKSVESVFEERFGRPLSKKVFDLGEEILWLDIGQHSAMREKVFLVNQDSAKGAIARKLDGLPEDRDANGNIIVDSFISPDVDVKDSVVVHSVILGQGAVRGSVIKNSLLQDVQADQAFVLHSCVRELKLLASSGVYKFLGESLALSGSQRSGTLLASEGVVHLTVEESADLKDKGVYTLPVLENLISFQEAYDKMDNISFAGLRRNSSEILESLKLFFAESLPSLSNGALLDKGREKWLREFLKTFEIYF